MRFVGSTLLALALMPAALTQAQIEEGGEARIQNESAVRMRLATGPALSNDKLAEVSNVVGAALSPIRRCYAERTASDPTIQGSLRAVVSLAAPASVEIDREEVGDRPLMTCVRRAFGAVDRGALPPPPGTAYVFLDFTSDAAEGVRAMATRAEEEGAVEVQRDAAGRPSAAGGLPNRLVTFTVEASAESPESQVQAVHRAVRAAIPTLLDCRRRASRRHPPDGEMSFRLFRRGRRIRVRAGRSSVEDPRGSRCVKRVLERASYDESAAGTTDVRVTFRSEPEPVEEPPAPAE